MAILRIIIAFLLLPAVAASLAGAGSVVVLLGNSVNDAALPFWLGLGSYFVFQIIFFKPLRTYVFGHELTHALAGLLSGAKLKSFSVGKNGGSVVLDKTNLVVVLAPYFVPLYALLIFACWWLAGFFWQMRPYQSWLLFLIGFTLSFHIALTVYALMQGQSDLKHFGPFFSGVVIVLVNCVVVVLLLKLVFPSEVSLHSCGLKTARDCFGMYKAIYLGIANI
jgi:hypothetical protein